MLLEITLKFIEQIIGLIKRREEIDSKYYSDFIAPLFINFETVHKNYVETFSQYRKLIIDDKNCLSKKHPIIDLIESDSLLSDNLRSAVLEDITANIEEKTKDFLAAISNYIGVITPKTLETLFYNSLYEENISLILKSCHTRYSLTTELLKIFSKRLNQKEKREFAIYFIDDLVAKLQLNYSVVVKEHNKLKRKLLKPK